MKKVIVLTLFICLIIMPLTAEKWVGKVATYQMLDGSKIANGDFFDRDSLSAACNGFRLGSDVTVTNVKTGDQITVTVNDRVGKDSTYFILLTPGAARELGIEWETSLVVVNGSFSDVNSVERLPVNGLVPEGNIDTERIREFPEVNWPDDKDIITTYIQENDDQEYPRKDIDEKEPLKRWENRLMDYDEKNGYQYIDKQEDIDELPEEDHLRKPLTERDGETMDGDKGDFELFYQEDLDDYPDEDYIKKPLERDRDELMDDDSGDFGKKEKLREPKNQKQRYPKRWRRSMKMDNDAEDGFNPLEEKYKQPLERESLMDEDGIDEPMQHRWQYPDKRKIAMDEDYSDTPYIHKIEQPDDRDQMMDRDEDEMEDPQNEYPVDPEYRRAEMDEDRDELYTPETDEDYPDKYRVMMDNDEDDSETPLKDHDKYPETDKDRIDTDTDRYDVTWATSLKKGRPYIRVSTTFDKNEGARRYVLFQKVFSDVIGVREKGRYILYIGPVYEYEIDTVLSRIREYGYKDAYVILP